jgi:hypothetical protein
MLFKSYARFQQYSKQSLLEKKADKADILNKQVNLKQSEVFK